MPTKIHNRRPLRHFIAEWMEKKGIDQTQLAGRLECETGTVSKIVNGRQRLSDPWIVGIADALGISEADLFRDPTRPTQEDLLEGLPEDRREQIIRVIRALREAG